MNALDVAAALDKSLHEAQNELAGAEIALLEATARAEEARDASLRLKAAVAALSGEPPPAADAPRGESENVIDFLDRTSGDGSSSADRSDKERAAAADMTPEEFDAQRKKRQRAREKELKDNNPLAHIKCAGCGVVGDMVDTITQAPSGATIRMMVCSSCNNQVMT